MGIWDRLLGREEEGALEPQPQRARTEDEVAVERYRYLLRTAPAATIEQVHEEAFAKLTPQQRALVFRELGENAAPGEAPISDEPRALARSATRSELRSPGTLERAFSPGAGGSAAYGGGPSFGSMVGGSLLGTVAGYVIGSALVSAFLPPIGYSEASGADQQSDDQQSDGGQDSGGDSGNGDSGADAGSIDTGGGWDGGDLGGGDFGGDFGF